MKYAPLSFSIFLRIDLFLGTELGDEAIAADVVGAACKMTGATADPRTHVKVRPNVRPNVRPKVRPKVEPKVKPSHVKSSKLLFVLFNFLPFAFYLPIGTVTYLLIVSDGSSARIFVADQPHLFAQDV